MGNVKAKAGLGGGARHEFGAFYIRWTCHRPKTPSNFGLEDPETHKVESNNPRVAAPINSISDIWFIRVKVDLQAAGSLEDGHGVWGRTHAAWHV